MINKIEVYLKKNKYIIILMSNYFKVLSQEYDREIRNKCENKKCELEKCFKESFNDNFLCEIHIKNFQDCIQDFNKKFRKKHNKYVYKVIA